MSKVTGVRATLIVSEDLDEDSPKFLELKKIPGSFYYYRAAGDDPDRSKFRGILFSCPCGCEKIGSLPLVKEEGRPVWDKTGPDNEPTLTPSVGIKPWGIENESVEADGFHWHGWLRRGIWQSV